jgi:hypothetical protein
MVMDAGGVVTLKTFEQDMPGFMPILRRQP